MSHIRIKQIQKTMRRRHFSGTRAHNIVKKYHAITVGYLQLLTFLDAISTWRYNSDSKF